MGEGPRHVYPPQPAPAAPNRTFLFLVAALTLLFVPGCHERVEQGGQVTYSYAWWVAPLWILISLLLVAAGRLMRRIRGELGEFLFEFRALLTFIMPGLLLIGIVPALFLERVVIDAEQVKVPHELWIRPSYTFWFQDLREIAYGLVEAPNGKQNRKLRFVFKSGEAQAMYAHGPIKYALPEICAKAKARGVRVPELGP